VISIITINRNNKAGLEKTFNSLNNQIFRDWEMIIVDGSSDDGSRELAQGLSIKDKRVKFIPQNGLGIYEAMNQGLDYATGTHSWFMNSGDSFYNSESLNLAAKSLETNSIDLLIGLHKIQTTFQHNSGKINPINLTRLLFSRNGTCHQAMIFNTKFIKKLNGYNLNYKIASDFDLLLKIFTIGKIFTIDKVLCTIEGNGFSDANLIRLYEEKFFIRNFYFSNKLHFRVSNFIWTNMATFKYYRKNF
jgi:glycosyltransferase involved in cell wall biosynthesis